jgi:hypothetical protein
MRPPRIRFTIGRLMVVVLLASFAWWGLFVVRPRYRDIVLQKQMAESRHKQAILMREVAEFALQEYSQGIKSEPVASGSQASARDNPLGYGGAYSRTAELRPSDLIPDAEESARAEREALNRYSNEKQRKMLISDIEKARADELAKFAELNKERARRWWSVLGF